MIKKLAILLILVIYCQAIIAQQQDYVFSYLNEKDGLSNNTVNCLIKDSRGILWAGTQSGLNRFDGAHFYVYKNKRNSNSLPNGIVNSICEDKKGNIWGATQNGIFCYAVAENNFKTYYAPTGSYDNNFINILCDEAGNIWATTPIDLIKFDAAKNTFISITKTVHDIDSVLYYVVKRNGLLRDVANNGFWVATQSGLLYYDCATKELLSFKNQPNNPLFARRRVSALAKSPKGHFWFSDNDTKQIVAFDPSTKKIIRTISIQKEIPNAAGSTIFEDSHNQLWYSSRTFDVLTVNLATDVIEKAASSIDGTTNSGEFIYAMLEDDNGTIWMGTTRGIAKCNPGKNIYKAAHLPQKIPLLKTQVITIIEEDPEDKSWWIATNHAFIIHYYPSTGKHEIWDLPTSSKNKQGINPGGVYFIRFTGNYIVCNTTNGAWQLLRGGKSFVPFTILPAGYTDFVVKDFVQEGDSVYYFTDRKQMLHWNRRTNKAQLIEYSHLDKTAKFKTGFAHLILKPGKPLWWLSGFGRVATLDSQLEPVFYKFIKNDTLEGGGWVSKMDMDAKGNIWIMHNGVGLYRYNPTTKQTDYWNEADGLVSNLAHTIRVDDKGLIWAIAFNKCSVFDPATKKFRNFNISYAEANINYDNWLIKRKDGVITAAIYNDIFEFDIDKLSQQPVKPVPVLSQIIISGTNYFITTETSLQLNPAENYLRFKFGLLVDQTAFPHEFEYMLEGSDKQWNKAAQGSEAVYNNLSPGTYKFRLVAKGINNTWQSAEKEFNIVIKTPFYKTAWFIVLLLLLGAAAVYSFYRYQFSQKEKLLQLENKTQLLEKEKAMVKYENLKQQLNPHFLFNSLSSLRSLIRTNTPLATGFLDGLSKTYRYLLRSGDTELVNLKDELDFVQIFVQLQKTRFDDGLQLTVDVPEELMTRKIAPVTIQGLIENAIKHNMVDEESPLHIEIFAEQENIIVRNNLQKIAEVETSNKKGLAALKTLYSYYTDKPLTIQEDEKYFTIIIPLI